MVSFTRKWALSLLCEPFTPISLWGLFTNVGHFPYPVGGKSRVICAGSAHFKSSHWLKIKECLDYYYLLFTKSSSTAIARPCMICVYPVTAVVSHKFSHSLKSTFIFCCFRCALPSLNQTSWLIDHQFLSESRHQFISFINHYHPQSITSLPPQTQSQNLLFP